MKKILIVDDDTDILDMLKLYFQFNGFEVRASTTCEEAMDIFYAFRPDLVLLDINVGSADGRVLCRTIKAHAEHGHIPVILISANTEALHAYKEHGASAGIEKPFNIQFLLSQVQAAMLPRP